MNDEIVREVKIAAPPEVVFGYFLDPVKIVRWKAVEADLDPRPGGLYRFSIDGRNVAAGSFVEIDAPKRLVYTWGWEGSDAIPPGSSTIEVTFEPDGDGTLLRLAHRGLPTDEARAQHAAGWEHYLLRLTLAAAGRDPGPDPWAA